MMSFNFLTISQLLCAILYLLKWFLSVLLIFNQFFDEIPCNITPLAALELDIPAYTVFCNQSGPCVVESFGPCVEFGSFG
jgi:hypothetical protein